MNLDFSADPQFSWYVVLLLVSGVAMIALSFAKSQGNVGQILNAVFGTLFVGYGIYLAFLFEGGSYWMFFQAFILPILLVFQWAKSLGRNRSA